MSYPSIPYEEARSWWNRWKGAEKTEAGPDDPPSVEEKKVGFPREWRSEACALVGKLLDLLGALGEGGGRDRFARFEAEAAVRIHQTLPRDHPALADPEFWIWYAVDPGLPLVRERYAGKSVPDVANFASPNARETMFYRLWLRGEMGWRPHAAEPYSLARYGDVDFWRSHVFRQMYAEYPALLEAFVRFQYPEGPDGPPRIALSDNQRELRTFVKRMKRIGTNVMVEFLDVDAALRMMEGEWNRLRREEMA
jgi:hypothetical protein